jgi:enoyl-CoA hydratase
MEFENIVVLNSNNICHITINRPKQLNALNAKIIFELNVAINKAQEDSSVRAIILTGSGNKAFVAGADIKEFAHFNASEGEELARNGQKLLFDLIDNLNIPCIAAVNGFALGGGLELAMSCHIRIASDNSKLGLPEVTLGVIPGYGGTQRLTNLVGKGKALEMIVTASMLSANEALQWGLVNHVCAQEDLLILANKIANKIIRNSPMAISKAIKSVNASFNKNLDGFEVEKKEFGSCFESKEFIEGTSAFMQKRKPNF